MRTVDTGMETARIPMRRSARVLLTAVCAFLLVVSLLLVARLQVKAQRESDTRRISLTADQRGIVDTAASGDLMASADGTPPYSQIRSPNMDEYITEKDSLTVSGIAWSEGTEPPYLTDDAHLALLRVNEMSYYAQWTDVISAQDYILQEAAEPGFESPTLNQPVDDTSYLLSKVAGEEGTYYYRVQAVDLDTKPRISRWSNVVSVTVPWSEASGNRSASTLSAELAVNDSMTLEVRTGEVGGTGASEWHSADVTATEWGGWEWSYEWPLPERKSTRYFIQTRASQEDDVFGSLDTITVTLDNSAEFVYFPLFYKRWPPIPYAPVLNGIDNPDQEVSYLVSWSYEGGPDVPNPTAYTLQEATDSDFTDPTTYYPINNNSFTITDDEKEKVGGTYYYRVRGHNTYGAGEWSNIRSTTVRVLPYAPTLNDIENEDQDGDYTVSWSYGYSYPPATSYTLREARDEDFTTGVQDYSIDSGTSKEFEDKEDGTYYYKVQANNDYGSSAWSDTRLVEVLTAYRDDFDDPDSGWKLRRTSSPKLSNMDMRYEGGKLYTKSEDNYDFGIFSPLVEAPPPPYRITMRTKLVEGQDAPAYGIVWRAEKGDFCPVDRDDAEDEDGCYYHYFRLNVSLDPGRAIRYEVKRIEEHDERGRGQGKALSGDKDNTYINVSGEAEWDEWNTWEVEVYEERFRISVNGEHVGTYWDDDYAEDGYFGILTSCYEYHPSEFKHDYFYIEPID